MEHVDRGRLEARYNRAGNFSASGRVAQLLLLLIYTQRKYRRKYMFNKSKYTLYSLSRPESLSEFFLVDIYMSRSRELTNF